MAKILVVDDETDLEILIKQKFRQKIRDCQYEFVFATNGNLALEQMKKHTDIEVYSSSKTTTDFPGIVTSSLLSVSFFEFLNAAGTIVSGFSKEFTEFTSGAVKIITRFSLVIHFLANAFTSSNLISGIKALKYWYSFSIPGKGSSVFRKFR